MLKKILVILLCLCTVFSLVACEGNDKPANSIVETTDNSSYTTTPVQVNPTGDEKVNEESEPVENTESTTESNWNVTLTWSAELNGSKELFYVSVPYSEGETKGYGNMSAQANIENGPPYAEVMVHTLGQRANSPEIDDISELLPACFSEIEAGLSVQYGLFAENFIIKVDEDKAITIGEYNMHMFAGTFGFDDLSGHKEFPFIAYATTLKANGAYAYWFVWDPSPDQSGWSFAEECALHMAETFRED